MKYICPICNYDGLDEPPYDEDGFGLYEICPCCGFQYGYDDFPNKDEQIKLWRQKWIDGGCQWFDESAKPR